MTSIEMEIHNHKISLHEDNRGSFEKIYYAESCKSCSESFTPAEIYLSRSSYGVIRGFHFQRSPKAIAKIVKVVQGKILDVSFQLEIDNKKEFVRRILDTTSEGLYIPKNFAHGFQVLSESATVLYITNGHYDKELDDGVHRSIYPDWENIPITSSNRDDSFPTKFFLNE
jgi:dTDP-4-dehydrorhamnose 3,5-epimerase